MDSAWAFDCRNTSRSRGPTPLTRLHLSPPSPPIRPFCVALYSALRHLAGHRPNHSGGSLARPARARPRRGEHVCRRVLVLSFFLSFFLSLSFSFILSCPPPALDVPSFLSISFCLSSNDSDAYLCAWCPPPVLVFVRKSLATIVDLLELFKPQPPLIITGEWTELEYGKEPCGLARGQTP